jgi:hypothetical protein
MYDLEKNIVQIINNFNILKELKPNEKEYQLKLVLNIIELLKTIYMTNINYNDFCYSYCVCVKTFIELKIKELLLLFKEEEKTTKCITVEDKCEITYYKKKELIPQRNYHQTKIVKNTHSSNIKKRSKNNYSLISKEFLKRNIKNFIKMISY